MRPRSETSKPFSFAQARTAPASLERRGRAAAVRVPEERPPTLRA
jgi:hypothetical protein